ncbi:dynein light intermediate chain-domain-containing protein [Phakopsora pachyrhizi]|nr:dynein light intermediate chain-domain-containing protein [Phakopsora pachyrhizi]
MIQNLIRSENQSNLRPIPSDQTNNRNDETNRNLWSTILDSVSNSREKGNIPNRRLILLGDRNSGKSTLVSYLSSSNLQTDTHQSSSNQLSQQQRLNQSATRPEDNSDIDLGLDYCTVDIGDDGDDDTLVRLSIHQIPSASPPFSSLLPLILNPDSLRESLILVLIPFSHPSSLLTSLVRWMVLIRSVIDLIKDSTTSNSSSSSRPTPRGEYILQEAKELLESQYRSYLEPSASNQPKNDPLEPNTNIHLLQDLPLPLGTLTENLGVGIVVVCTKSDKIDQLEREKDFKEEHFDFIQQVLRSICLRFGGSLFFTSEKKPDSMIRLRSYVLHRLFGQIGSSASSISNLGATPSGTASTSSRPFSFPHKANVVDRDEVLIPMGWDSWGKIKILRDGFDPQIVGDGWLLDLDRHSRRSTSCDPDRSGSAKNNPDAGEKEAVEEGVDEEEEQVGWDAQGRRIVSACKLWQDTIGEPDDDIHPLGFQDRVIVTQEQQFLKTKYESIKKERDLDPRSHFQISSKGHSAQQLAKFSNGILLSDKNLAGSGTPPGLGSEEQINVRLNQFSSVRDQGLNGRTGGSSISAVVDLHHLQTNAPPSKHSQTSTPNPLLPTAKISTTSPVSNLSNINETISGRINSNSIANSSSGDNNGLAEKDVLASFFGKLLVKDTNGPRGIGSVFNSSNSGNVGTSSSNNTNGRAGNLNEKD